MPLVSARSLILQTFPFSDTSKILRLYTLEHGLRSAVAKGALRPKSRFGGLLEPFTEGEALLYLKEGRDLHTLGGFDLVRSRQGLGRDLAAFAGASLVAELLLRFTTEEPNSALFWVGSGSLDAILSADRSQTEVAVLSAVWSIIALLGYQPEIDVCVTCGTRIDPEESARFDVEAGGVACVVCRPAGRVLDAQARAELRCMLHREELPGTFARATVQRALLRAFLSAHLRQEHPLRSLELFFQQLSSR